MSRKKVKAQLRVFKELENQLLTQAERLGVKEDFAPLQLKEIEYEALEKHILAFYAERANLEYEMQMMGSNKKETLIKLERLHVYISRAERMKKLYEQNIQKMHEKMVPDKEKALRATTDRTRISVSIGGNN